MQIKCKIVRILTDPRRASIWLRLDNCQTPNSKIFLTIYLMFTAYFRESFVSLFKEAKSLN